MKDKFLQNKIKNEKGFVSLVVVYSVLFFVIVLLGIFARVTSNESGQVNSVSKIKAKYENNMNNIEEVYQNVNVEGAPKVEKEQTDYTGEYTISDVASLNNFIANNNNNKNYYSGKKVYLTQDIDLAETSLSQVSDFAGTLEGEGHTIKNLVKTGSAEGLFLKNNGTINNLNLENVNITGTTYTGAVVSQNYGTISNCKVSGTVTSSDEYLGGIAGKNIGGTLINNSNSATINNNGEYAGGIVGENNSYDSEHVGKIQKCYNTGTITGLKGLGGIAGVNYANCLIEESNNSGIISSSSYHIGGIVGKNVGIVRNGYNEGKVSTSTSEEESNIGGIVGINYDATASISNVYNLASVEATSGKNVGGIVGKNIGLINSVYNVGKVSGKANVGGVLGKSASDVTYDNLSNVVDVVGTASTDTNVGGIVGYSSKGNFSNCKNYGNINGKYYVGGIAGNTNVVTIANSYNSGIVSGTIVGVGGIVGGSDANVTSCKNYGQIKGNSSYYVGGIVGTQWNSPITNCVNKGLVSTSYDVGLSVSNSKNAKVGGIVGKLESTDVKECENYGIVKGIYRIGGIVGENYKSKILNCDNYADVKGRQCIGGISGGTDSEVSNCTNKGIIDSTDFTDTKNVGGIAAELYENSDDTTFKGNIINCENYAQIKGGNITGGITGSISDEATINGSKNYGLIIGERNIGGIAGTINSGVIDNCKNIASAYAIGDDKEKIGGIVGSTSSGTVKNSTNEYNKDEKIGQFNNNYVGGIVGYNNSASVIDCINYNYVIASQGVGGIVGINDSGTVDGCTNDGHIQISVDNDGWATGGIVGAIVDWNNYDNNYIRNCNNTGVIDGIYQSAGIVGDARSKGEISNCTNTGIVNLLSYGESAAGIVDYVKDDSMVVDSCINSGTVNGYKRTGGIVGVVELGTVKNSINEVSAKVYAEESLGGVVGEILGGNIEACTNNGNMEFTEENKIVGGILGLNVSTSKDCTIKDCINNSDIKVGGENFDIGGIVGACGKDDDSKEYFVTNIVGCKNNGAINGYESVAGILGKSEVRSVITDCHNYGAVIGKNYIAGIAGYVYKTDVIGSTNEGSITGNYITAGILGEERYSGLIYNNINSGNINGDDENTAGIVASMTGGSKTDNEFDIKATNLKNTGTIRGSTNVGGIVANIETGYLANSINDANIIGEYMVGGINGRIVEGEIYQCGNNATNSTFVGKPENENLDTGIVGGVSGYMVASKISECYNKALVTANWRQGGIVGQCNGFVENSYNLGEVKAIGYTNDDGSYDKPDLAAGLIGLTTKEESTWVNRQVESEKEDGSDITVSEDGDKTLIDTKTVKTDSGDKTIYVFDVSDTKTYNSTEPTCRKCYNTGIITSDGYDLAGLIGEYNGSKVENAYYTDESADDWCANICDETGYSVNMATESKVTEDTMRTQDFVITSLGGTPFVFSEGNYPNLSWE